MKELVIISGKGGTGKTSITASFAALAECAVLADCDVDAADLHLVLSPVIQTSETFTSGRAAEIRPSDCTQCGLCETICRFDAVLKVEGRVQPRPNADEQRPGWNRALHISQSKPPQSHSFIVDPLSCEGCGVCVEFCPVKAIDFPEQNCGVWNSSSTRAGPMVHARMNPGAENSGKLVSLVRQEARKIAEQQNRDFLLVDGPPGIGCPVIASITGADAVLVVSEPTLSGEHDLNRVLELAGHFKVPAMVCINKWDINEAMTQRIEEQVTAMGARPVGRIPYDAAVTEAQINACALVEHSDGEAATAVKQLWSNVCSTMQ